MIYSLTGKIIKKTLNAVVICCGGVGYYAQCPASVAGALPGVGSEAALAVSKIDGTLPVEEIIKLALRSMAGRR